MSWWSSKPKISPSNDTYVFHATADVDDAAERLLNPRPSMKQFASLADREEEHARLFGEGVGANAAGDLNLACECFAEAYALLFRTATLLSLINMKLKLGEAELAAACYAKVLKTSGALLHGGEKRRLEDKLFEAKSLHASVRAIMDAPQAGLLNDASDRELSHRKLVDRGKAANSAGDWEEAERLFLEAWPLTFRVSTLVSAANMMAHRGGRRLRQAVGVYHALLRNSCARLIESPMTEEEERLVRRKLEQAVEAICAHARKETAARTVQTAARGASARRAVRALRTSTEVANGSSSGGRAPGSTRNRGAAQRAYAARMQRPTGGEGEGEGDEAISATGAADGDGGVPGGARGAAWRSRRAQSSKMNLAEAAVKDRMDGGFGPKPFSAPAPAAVGATPSYLSRILQTPSSGRAVQPPSRRALRRGGGLTPTASPTPSRSGSESGAETDEEEMERREAEARRELLMLEALSKKVRGQHTVWVAHTPCTCVGSTARRTSHRTSHRTPRTTVQHCTSSQSRSL